LLVGLPEKLAPDIKAFQFTRKTRQIAYFTCPFFSLKSRSSFLFRSPRLSTHIPFPRMKRINKKHEKRISQNKKTFTKKCLKQISILSFQRQVREYRTKKGLLLLRKRGCFFLMPKTFFFLSFVKCSDSVCMFRSPIVQSLCVFVCVYLNIFLFVVSLWFLDDWKRSPYDYSWNLICTHMCFFFFFK
jgi:hypothetical protein